MREYELGVVLKPSLNEEKLEAIYKKYETMMKKNKGEILFKNPWGVRKLAYPINNQSKGHYVFYNFANSGDCVSELEKILRIDEDVLRFLTVKISDGLRLEGLN